MQLMKPKIRSVLGIDISSSSVKLLEISRDGDEYCVQNYCYEPLPDKAVEGGLIQDVDIVADSIKSAVAKNGIKTKHVALCVPDSNVITKMIQLNEGLNEEEMEELVIMEADKYIPYPIDEINIDFNVIGPSEKNPNMVDILIVASRAENISTRANIIAQAGLEAKIIDVESYAVERAIQVMAPSLPSEGKDKIIAVIDIGANTTSLYVFEGMNITFTREESFGASQLIQIMMDKYDLSHEEALQIFDTEKYPENYIEEVLKPFYEVLMIQVRRTLQFFYSVSKHDYVDYILLAGGMARQPGLPELLIEQLKIETTVVNPFQFMKVGKNINPDNLHRNAPTLMVACGLAMRNMDNL